ncbi:MAG: hypothetical protein ACRESZ_17780, partial [Methylococcales bacterium]
MMWMNAAGLTKKRTNVGNAPFSNVIIPIHAEIFQSAFVDAARATQGVVEYFCCIVGKVIRICFAGSAMVPKIMPALECHRLATNALNPLLPEFTIYVWDSESTRTAMPPGHWTQDNSGLKGRIRHRSGSGVHTVFDADTGIVSMISVEEKLAVYWIQDFRKLPYYEMAAPLLTILHWWLKTQSCHLLHAAAVGKNDGGILFVGRGGSGKSTIAFSCLQSPLFYASDDYCIAGNDFRPYVYSLYNSAKLDQYSMNHFPQLVPEIKNHNEFPQEKGILFLHEKYADKLIAGFPLKAILIPKITQFEPMLR